MIRLGPWSTTLLVGSIHGLVIAGLLLRARANVAANRFLAALLVGVVLLITPYTIGYAGFYDAYPWLSFAPYDWRLAFGPSLYFYVRRLVTPGLPPRWRWHFIPAFIQGGYYAVMFVQPLPVKDWWDGHVQVPWIVPIETIAVYASLGVYWVAAVRAYRASQTWLDHHSAAREEFRLSWLRGFLIALAVVIVLQVGFDATVLVGVHLDYFDRFPLYLALTALVYYLGVEGWRHADQRFPGAAPSRPARAAPTSPAPTEAATADASPDHAPPDYAPPGDAPPVDAPADSAPLGAVASPDRDWTAQGQAWAARITAQEWWREPDLDLAELARRLGTNTRYVSRALNEGLGVSFSEFINRARVDEAKRRLRGPGEILAIALEVGFASKASFNRAFKLYAGCTPSAYRAGADATAASSP
ncbi:MAG: AraC family transcriptional regulator [Kofleriaceae bacterium]